MMDLQELQKTLDQIRFQTAELNKAGDRLKSLGDLPQNIEKLAQVFSVAPKELKELHAEFLSLTDNVEDRISELQKENMAIQKAKFAPASLIAYAAACLAAIAMFATAFYFFQNAREYQNTIQNISTNQSLITDLASKNIRFDGKTGKTKDGKNVIVLNANTKVELLDAQTIILYEKK